MKKPHKHILARLSSEIWALPPDFIRLVHDIVADRPDISPEDLEKFQKMREASPWRAIGPLGGVPVEGRESVLRVGPVGLMSIQGPILRYADFFTAMSGGTTLDDVLADFLALEADPRVESIVQVYDTPGGQATGILETADRFARGQKPRLAYIEGAGLSAGYALAASADEIVLGPMAEVGSVGVAAMVPTDKPRGRLQLVSSQTPKKRPDPTTDEGRREMQSRVDALGAEIIDGVARMRGLEPALVAAWQGGVATGAAAVKNRMADRTSVLVDLISETAGGPMAKKEPTTVIVEPAGGRASPTPNPPAPSAADQTKLIEERVTAAVTQERERARACLRMAAPKLESSLGSELWAMLWDGKSSDGDVAKAVLAAERARGEAVTDSAPEPLALVPASDQAPKKPAAKTGTVEERAKAAWDAEPDTRAEFGGDEKVHLAWFRAQDAGLLTTSGRSS